MALQPFAAGTAVRWLFLCTVAAAALFRPFAPPIRSVRGKNPRAPVIPVQSGASSDDLDAGKFLVARRDLPDPNFAQTVVLLIHYDEDDGAMGVIINRQTRLPLSRVFRELKEAEGRTDPVFAGGPVARTDGQGLLRSRTKPDDADPIFSDVYLVSTKNLLEKTLRAGTESAKFRLYLGYAGWAEGQLEHEIELGMWYVFPGDAEVVFDPKPETVWSRLIQRTELQLAHAAAGTGCCSVW
jgi:putative transcriptional regulator